jgi:hypothetical protein
MEIIQPKDFRSAHLWLTWNRNFGSVQTAKLLRVQQFIDSECIRLMVPYTPMLTGKMRDSATLGTVIGSGRIVYLSPYARYQYYGKLMVSRLTGSSYARRGESKVLTNKDLRYQTSRQFHAGAFWFERMKHDRKAQILKGAGRLLT